MSDSREERERLKEEYKQHYRKMRETKERLSRTRNSRNIARALQDMDTSGVMETFDDFLFKVKSKLATVEARLDVAMESLSEEGGSAAREEELEEEMSRERARETLRQVKMEMGSLYSEIEKQASAMDVRKTIGPEEGRPESGSGERDAEQSESSQ